MAHATYISVRDKYSRQVLIETADIDPDVFACPAWLFRKHGHKKDPSLRNALFRMYYNLKCYRPQIKPLITSGKKIGLGINGHFNQKWLPSIKEHIVKLSKSNQIYFIPFVGEDMEFYKREISSLPIKCFKLQSPINTYKSVKKMDKMIVMRYHSLIFSLLADKPVMILAYSQKVVSLAEELELQYTNLMDDSINNLYKFTKVSTSKIEGKISQAQLQSETLISRLDKV
jgi:hypothetical protein